MPGDPNRAYYIAHKYLKDARMVNKVRGELAFTGTYKDVSVTIFSSGMGIGSMGIYSYELFNDYDVQTIIRIGTAGAYTPDLKLYDIVLADSAYSKTFYDDEAGIENVEILNSSFELNSVIQDTAAVKGIKLTPGRVHTSLAFYSESKDYSKYTDKGCVAVEMETFALLFNAKKFKRQATALLTISDNLVTHEIMDSSQREKTLDEMIVLALEAIIKK
jgi:purine-nucleoside phosphorylase